MLWLGLLQRDTRIPASKHLKIRDEVVALDFNLAVTLRLLRYDNEVRKQQAKLTVSELSRWWNGEPERDDVHDLIAQDKYADENTQIM